MKIPTSITIALACLTPLASAQTFTTIATESFDYAAGSLDGMSGGSGWLNAWTGANASVTSPGFDAIGNKATTTVENGGNWRTIDAGAFPVSGVTTLDANSNPAFGVDDTTIWLTYRQQRVAGSVSDYGGLSLTGFFLGEKLFVGSPGGTDEMGVDTSFCCGGPMVSIPATNGDSLHEIVVRVDFVAGPEFVSLWLDPAVPHPDLSVTPPDLATTAPNFLFNEIRLQSGGGAGGFDFDSILIELETGSLGTNYCVANVNASGNPAPMSASGSASIAANDLVLSCGPVPPGQPGIFFYSTTQAANPSGIPFGEGQRCAIGAISRLLPPVFPDGMGNLNRPVDYNNLPAGGAITAGSTWNFQGWYRDTGDSNGDGTASSFNLSDGLEVMFTP